METIRTDILILGTGGAGLMAALHAFWRDPSLSITLVSKGMLGKSGCTRMVQGGYNVVLDPKDSLQAHFEDTVKGGGYLNDQELAWTLVEDAPRVVKALENKIGCLFDRRPDGQIHQKAFAGQTFDRTVHVGDLTGIEIMSRLRDQIFATGITCLENTRGLELLTSADEKSVVGALLLDIQTGDYVQVQSKAVILCTGAGPLMYQRAACAQEKAMDGIGMAYRVGAKLMDMEMVQFHPTGLVVPGSRLNGALLEEGLRGAGAHLFNGKGERYMERYDPERKERSTRDRVSRAGFMEIMAGRGTPNGGVLIDVSHLGAEFVEKNFTGMRDRCLRIGFDLARERVEVAPTAHFNMGGIRINRDGFTNLEGLFAAGEDAAGVHGANRLGGNGVAESTVYGARVGHAVAGWVKNIKSHQPTRESQIAEAQSQAEEFLGSNGAWSFQSAATPTSSGAPVSSPAGASDSKQVARLALRGAVSSSQEVENPWVLREELGKVMWERVGIVRDGAKLKQALDEIRSLQERAQRMRATGKRTFNLTWQQALDMRNMLLASELIARSALTREDSRGAHYREDFPEIDNANWLKNVYMSRDGAGPKIWAEAVKLDKLRP